MPQADSKSSSGQEQQQTVQTMTPYPSAYPLHFEDDTIDLYDLWISLWKRKWLIIAVTVVTALGSIVYALQLQSIYKAEALLLPPKEKNVQFLNVIGIQIKNQGGQSATGISANTVFSKFKQNLSSRTLYKKFIQENGLMELLAPERTPESRNEDIIKRFAELVKLEEADGLTSLSIELHDSEIASLWVNDIIEFVDKETIAMIVDDLQNSIANQVRDIEYTIESKRKMVKQRREDQITEIERTIDSKRRMASLRLQDKIFRYEEAAKTAKSLGIMTGLTQQTKLVDSTSGGVSPITSREKFLGSPPIAQMNVDIATATTPLFFMGYDALVSELQILRSRTNDDPFIPGLRDLQERLVTFDSIMSKDSFIDGLRDLQERLALLSAVKFDNEKMSAVHIDQAAYPPKYAIKPNRRLIVFLSTVAGLFSGIFLALLIEYVKNQREKHSE